MNWILKLSAFYVIIASEHALLIIPQKGLIALPKEAQQIRCIRQIRWKGNAIRTVGRQAVERPISVIHTVAAEQLPQGRLLRRCYEFRLMGTCSPDSRDNFCLQRLGRTRARRTAARVEPIQSIYAFVGSFGDGAMQSAPPPSLTASDALLTFWKNGKGKKAESPAIGPTHCSGGAVQHRLETRVHEPCAGLGGTPRPRPPRLPPLPAPLDLWGEEASPPPAGALESSPPGR